MTSSQKTTSSTPAKNEFFEFDLTTKPYGLLASPTYNQQSLPQTPINLSQIFHYVPPHLHSEPIIRDPKVGEEEARDAEDAASSEEEDDAEGEVAEETAEEPDLAKEAEKLKPAHKIRPVKVSVQFNQQAESMREARTFRETTFSKLLLEKKDKAMAATGSDAVSDKDMAEILNETEQEMKKYLKEHDVDLNWLKVNFVMQPDKDHYRKEVLGLMSFINPNLYLLDQNFISDMLDDEPLSRTKIHHELHDIIIKAFHFVVDSHKVERLECTSHGDQLTRAHQARENSHIMEKINKLSSFIREYTRDDTVGALEFQQNVELLLDAVVNALQQLSHRRYYAYRREVYAIIAYIKKNKIPQDSLEYLILFHVTRLFAELESSLHQTLKTVREWQHHLNSDGSESEESDNEFVPKKKHEQESTDDEIVGSNDDESDEPTEEDDEEEDEEEASQVPEVPKKAKVMQEQSNKPPKQTKKAISKPKEEKPTSTNDPPSKTKSKSLVVKESQDPEDSQEEEEDAHQYYIEFKTLNIFCKELQKVFTIPQNYILHALNQADISLVVLKQEGGTSDVQGSQSPDKTKNDVSISQFLSLEYFANGEKFVVLLKKPKAKDAGLSLAKFCKFVEIHKKILSKSPMELQDWVEFYTMLFPRSRGLLYVFLNHFVPSELGNAVQPSPLVQESIPVLASLTTQVGPTHTVISLLEKFYGEIYKNHPRGASWKTDKKSKHREQASLSQTDAKRFVTQYQKKVPPSLVEAGYSVVFPKL